MGNMNTNRMIKPGDRFAKLTAIKHVCTKEHYRRYFLFRCDCGNEKILQISNVATENTKSCGCLAKNNHTKRTNKMEKTKQGAKTAIYLQYKRHAKSRGIPFELTKDELIAITHHDYHYCGQPPSNLKKTKNDQKGLLYSGVNRWDNKKGYTLDNCQPCCKICNYAKRDMTWQQFRAWITKAHNHQIAMAEQWG